MLRVCYQSSMPGMLYATTLRLTVDLSCTTDSDSTVGISGKSQPTTNPLNFKKRIVLDSIVLGLAWPRSSSRFFLWFS